MKQKEVEHDCKLNTHFIIWWTKGRGISAETWHPERTPHEIGYSQIKLHPKGEYEKKTKQYHLKVESRQTPYLSDSKNFFRCVPSHLLAFFNAKLLTPGCLFYLQQIHVHPLLIFIRFDFWGFYGNTKAKAIRISVVRHYYSEFGDPENIKLNHLRQWHQFVDRLKKILLQKILSRSLGVKKNYLVGFNGWPLIIISCSSPEIKYTIFPNLTLAVYVDMCWFSCRS